MPTYSFTDQVLDQNVGTLASESHISVRRTITSDAGVIDPVNELEAMVTANVLPILDEPYSVSGTGYSWHQSARARC